MISLDLFGDPVGKKRHAGHGKQMYDPQQKLKEGYKWQVRSLYREEPLMGPLVVDVVFMMPIPKSTSKVKQRAMMNGTYHHMFRPDVDNLQKFILDVLNEIVFKDDAQVIEIRAKKIYSSKPGTHIRVIPIENLSIQPVDHADNQRNHR